MSEDVQDLELGIIECLQDYHRILVNAAQNASGANGSRKRGMAAARATMVKQLIERVQALSDEPLPGEEAPSGPELFI